MINETWWTFWLVQRLRAHIKGALSLKVYLDAYVTCQVFAQGLYQEKYGFCFYKLRIYFVQILPSICWTIMLSAQSKIAAVTWEDHARVGVHMNDIKVGVTAMETFPFFNSIP